MNINLDIASAASSRAAKWKNTRTNWQAIALKLSETERTKETLKQYFGMTKDKQDEIKDVGGFVGGRLLPGTCKIKGVDVTYKAPYGWRRKGFVDCRQIVALDVDFGDLDLWLDFKLFEYVGLMYTTHKHTREAPRFRVVFPLDREVTPDEYEAIARKVADWLDIENFDDTTYQPTRLMYYPSTAKDGEFIYDYNEGAIMSADAVLAEYEDWTDPTTWPVSSREVEVRRPGSTVADPEAKDGIIGAFCRAFTIEEAIAEFLSEIYEPCDELGADRYSYVDGSTSGGLIVYDHKHAFSHHNTDPAGQRLCNSFDLVRLHRFGDMDAGKDFADDVTKAPSFKAMADFAGSITEVKKEIVRARRAGASDDYDELDIKAREVALNDDWVGELETEGKSAKIKNTIANVVLILNNDEYLAGRFGYNSFSHREICVSALPWDKAGLKYPRPLVDKDDAQLRLYLERAYDITTVGKITDALNVVVDDNSVNPVKNYLDACVWDGVPRLDTLFVDLFGADDTPFTRAVTRKLFCAAVLRIYRPGCIFDYVTVLAGDEGTGKSKTLKTMARDWFTDSIPALGNNKDAMEAIQGSWIGELGELDSINRTEAETVKAFVSKTDDEFRVAYGKRKDFFPRTIVFVGTTNKTDFLRAVTGNRRFWIINFIGRGIAGRFWWSDYLTEVTVSQIWGEARQRLADGEVLFLEGELEAEAKVIQNAHLETDDRAGMITEYLNRPLPLGWLSMDPEARRYWLSDEDNRDKGDAVRGAISVIEIWTECLGKRAEDITRRDSQDLGRVLRTLRDWQPNEKAARIPFYGLQRSYERVTSADGKTL